MSGQIHEARAMWAGMAIALFALIATIVVARWGFFDRRAPGDGRRRDDDATRGQP